MSKFRHIWIWSHFNAANYKHWEHLDELWGVNIPNKKGIWALWLCCSGSLFQASWELRKFFSLQDREVLMNFLQCLDNHRSRCHMTVKRLSMHMDIYIYSICTEAWTNREIHLIRQCDLSFTLLIILEFPFIVDIVAVSEQAKSSSLLSFALMITLCLSWYLMEKHSCIKSSRKTDPAWGNHTESSNI